MIDHMGIGVADIGRSAAFYDAALGALGLRRLKQIPDGSGADGIGYGARYPVCVDRFHSHGLRQHTAFAARNRREVEAFHTAAVKAGGTDCGALGLNSAPSGTSSGYPGGCYAAFVIGPDGNNIEAVFRED